MRRKRSFGGLLVSWLAYWAIVFAIKLGPALAAIWRVTRAPNGDQGNIAASFSGAVLSLVVKLENQVQWSGAAHVGVIAAWIGVGPLVLWALWMLLAARAAAAAERSPVR
jgi:hypothetical protein